MRLPWRTYEGQRIFGDSASDWLLTLEVVFLFFKALSFLFQELSVDRQYQNYRIILVVPRFFLQCFDLRMEEVSSMYPVGIQDFGSGSGGLQLMRLRIPECL